MKPGVTPGILARGNMAGVALYASLFDPPIARLQLIDLPASHAEGPEFLNVLRFLDMPQAVAMAAERTSVQLDGRTAGAWQFPTSVAANLGWDRERLRTDCSLESQPSQ